MQSVTNHYIYIKTNTWWAKVKKKFYQLSHGKEYYHYTIEYYLHEALKHIRHQQYDIILLENRPDYAIKLKDITEARLVYHLHNEKLSYQVAHYREIYDAASRILTVSDYISSRVRTINPSDTKCIRVHNGSDITLFHPGKPSKITRSQLHIADDDFILYFSGRIIPEKGVLELIKAVRLLDHPHIKLLIIGSSFYGNVKADSPYIQALKAEAKAIQERIIFTGYIPYTELPNYLWISDVAVVPSLWEEPFGNTVVEAMAAGVPLITTRSGGIPEICEGVATIVERDDIVNSLAQSILDLYEHPEKRRQLSAAALERSRQFDKDTYARNFFEALTA